jgi:hypothetical protein
MKEYGGVDVQIHASLTSALVGGEWSGSRPGRFTPGEKASGAHWIGGWRRQSLYRLRYPQSFHNFPFLQFYQINHGGEQGNSFKSYQY